MKLNVSNFLKVVFFPKFINDDQITIFCVITISAVDFFLFWKNKNGKEIWTGESRKEKM